MFNHRNLTDSSVLPANDSDSMRIPSLVGEIPHINIAFLNILITHLEDYETDLDAVKTIIHDNQIKAHQANLDIFNQLMEWLDNLGTAPAERTHIDFQVPCTLSGTSSLIAVNVLT